MKKITINKCEYFNLSRIDKNHFNLIVNVGPISLYMGPFKFIPKAKSKDIDLDVKFHKNDKRIEVKFDETSSYVYQLDYDEKFGKNGIMEKLDINSLKFDNVTVE